MYKRTLKVKTCPLFKNKTGEKALKRIILGYKLQNMLYSKLSYKEAITTCHPGLKSGWKEKNRVRNKGKDRARRTHVVEQQGCGSPDVFWSDPVI